MSTSEIPVPPFFHLAADPVVSVNSQGEIEQLLTFHEGARIAICYTPAQAERLVDALLKLCVARRAATVSTS